MTAADLLAVAAVVLLGVLAGNEAGTLLVIHPSLDRLPPAAARPAAQAVVAGYGRVMPVLMPVSLAVTVVAGIVLGGTAGILMLIAGGALAVMIAITFARLMPLNTLQLDADPATPDEVWEGWRARWRRWHTVRVACDLLALLLVAVAVVNR